MAGSRAAASLTGGFPSAITVPAGDCSSDVAIARINSSAVTSRGHCASILDKNQKANTARHDRFVKLMDEWKKADVDRSNQMAQTRKEQAEQAQQAQKEQAEQA